MELKENEDADDGFEKIEKLMKNKLSLKVIRKIINPLYIAQCSISIPLENSRKSLVL